MPLLVTLYNRVCIWYLFTAGWKERRWMKRSLPQIRTRHTVDTCSYQCTNYPPDWGLVVLNFLLGDECQCVIWTIVLSFSSSNAGSTSLVYESSSVCLPLTSDCNSSRRKQVFNSVHLKIRFRIFKIILYCLPLPFQLFATCLLSNPNQQTWSYLPLLEAALSLPLCWVLGTSHQNPSPQGEHKTEMPAASGIEMHGASRDQSRFNCDFDIPLKNRI